MNLFNTSTGKDRHSWYIHLVHVSNKWILENKQDFEHIDVAECFLH
ncbi:hypothetical protein VDG1235_874 [Verrucomicrobiia bacterium DG1235]|nr:hypothetical protein VDG1235_874 [Verrucomicrobiae bacterium DG1235]